MITIQQVGTEILTGNPQKFYIFGGLEYGIKETYVATLEKLYGNRSEWTSMKELISFLSNNHIIEPQPSVYVVRYDEEFVSKVDDTVVKKIHNLKFNGCIICMYENSKHVTKLDKLFSSNVVLVDKVNSAFIAKHIKSEFVDIGDKLISLIAKLTDNYNQARLVCSGLAKLDADSRSRLSELEVLKLFGKQVISTEKDIRIGIASRNFKFLSNIIDNYSDDLSSLIYTFLSTMIELDKLMDNPKGESDIRPYVNRWTRSDVYYMFMHAYNQLIKLRTIAQSPYESLIYLSALLQFKPIPEVS